ncbi:MAG: APC family permease, partial [Clostridiales bacterium]
VGRVASYFSVIVIATFVIMTIMGFSKWQFNPISPFIPEGQTVFQSIGLGVAICMWMYSGYESMSTMAGEMENPQVIPKATLLSVPAIMLVYILPTIAGLASVGRWTEWSTEGGVSFATVATQIGFPLFGAIFVLAALVSNLSMYNTYLASGSRGFYALADDNLAPKSFAKLHPKYGTPYIAILSMAVINLVLCQFGFDTLVVIDVFLLMFAYILIYIAAIILRIKEPNLERAFKIPLGTKGLILMCTPPILLAVIALFTNGWDYFIGGMIGAISGPIAYFIFKKKYGGLAAKKAE